MTGLEVCKTLLNSFRPFLAKGSINQAISKWLHTRLIQDIPFFSSPIFEMRFSELQRVTINKYLFDGNNKQIDEVKFIKYPPADKVTRHGRANLIGQSIFYSTSNPITALKEMKPQIGDTITTSIWRQKNNRYHLKISPVFKITSLNGVVHNELSLRFKIGYENALKQHDPDTAAQIDELLQFVADCFAKDVEYGNNFDYTMSAFYANKILYEFEGGSIDALVYPSVADKLDFSNIAIKPSVFEDQYEPYEVHEGIVATVPNAPGGGFVIHGTGWSRTFEDGKIIWK